MENKKPDHNAIVAKDNSLIPQLAKLDLQELRFLAYCLAHYNSKEVKNRQITARVADLCEFFPMNESSAYRVIRQAIFSLGKKPAEFTIDKTRYLYHWFSGLRYQIDTGEFTFCISPEMEPFLLGLAGNFTQWRLGDVYQFKAASTWKLYENLAQWRIAGRWTVSLDELRLRLGVAGKYPIWNLFRQRLIAPAIEEINTLSDIRVEYHQEKRGRRVIGLLFLIDKKIEDEKTIVLEPPADELLRLLLSHGINAVTAENYSKKIVAAGKTNTIIAQLPEISERAKKSNSMPAYILGAITNILTQTSLFEDSPPPPPPRPDHAEALDCWTEKRRNGEVCPVRQRGEAGQRKKCQICLEKIPVEIFEV